MFKKYLDASSRSQEFPHFLSKFIWDKGRVIVCGYFSFPCYLEPFGWYSTCAVAPHCPGWPKSGESLRDNEVRLYVSAKSGTILERYARESIVWKGFFSFDFARKPFGGQGGWLRNFPPVPAGSIESLLW